MNKTKLPKNLILLDGFFFNGLPIYGVKEQLERQTPKEGGWVSLGSRLLTVKRKK